MLQSGITPWIHENHEQKLIQIPNSYNDSGTKDIEETTPWKNQHGTPNITQLKRNIIFQIFHVGVQHLKIFHGVFSMIMGCYLIFSPHNQRPSGHSEVEAAMMHRTMIFLANLQVIGMETAIFDGIFLYREIENGLILLSEVYIYNILYI